MTPSPPLPPPPDGAPRSRPSAAIAVTAILIGLLAALFLLAVGVGPDSLPFPRQSDYSDAATSHWPNVLLIRRAVQAGTFPAVNPYIMNGSPFLPNPLNMALYPPQWAAAILPPTVHLDLLLWLHLTIGGLGMAMLAGYWLRSTGPLNWPLRVFAGAAYALMPRLIAAAGAGHLDIIYAAAWLPWLLWLVSAGAKRIGVGRAIAIGVLATLTFYADIRLYVFILAATAIGGLACAAGVRRSAGRPLWGPWVRGVILAVALHAALIAPLLVMLVPVLPALTRSLTITEAGAFSLDPLNLISLFVGDQNGAHETMIYPGIGVLALALLAAFNAPRRTAPWLIGALAAALYALGINNPLWRLLVGTVPGLSLLRVPARAWLVAGLCLILLAMFGLEALVAAPAGRTTRQLRAATGRTVVILLAVGLPAAAIFFTVDRYSASTSAALLIVAVLLLITSTVPFRGLPRPGPLAVFGLWAALAFADLLMLNITLIEGVPQSDWLDQYAPVAAALRADSGHPVDHLYSPSYSFPQQAAVYYQIPILGGVDPFQLRCYAAAVELATGVRATGYSVTLPALEGDPLTVNQNAHIDAAKLAALRVSHIASAFPIADPELIPVGTLYGIDNHILYLYRNARYTPADAARDVLREVCPDVPQPTPQAKLQPEPQPGETS